MNDEYKYRWFVNNIEFFIDNMELIFADRKMFFAPVPVPPNGLAYINVDLNMTLGMYLELWSTCPASVVVKQGVPNYIFRFGGSPLSGGNVVWYKCECCGTIVKDSILNFSSLWRMASEICKKYANHSALAPYSVRKVKSIINKL